MEALPTAMRSGWLRPLAAAVLGWPTFFLSEPGMTDLNLSTDETRVSYGIGRQLGDQLRDNPRRASVSMR